MSMIHNPQDVLALTEPVGRPRRQIHEADGFLTVERSSAWFWTTDRVFAEEVRKVLDRIDPLPCPHEGRIFERHSLSGRRDFLCSDCGKAFESDPQEVT